MRPALLAVLALALSGAAVAATRPPARVQVSADEFQLTLSRAAIKAGPAIVELANFGEDPHDLRLKRVGGTRIYKVPITQAGDHFDLQTKLLPGKFVLWCSLAGHRALGMQAVLTVKK
jgi:hypothetical protein